MITTQIVYILFSNKLNRFYIGYTSNIDTRLDFHFSSPSKTFTSNAKDWILFYSLECASKLQALKIEKHIKNMKSKVYIENLLKFPEISIKLLDKYKDC